MNMSDFSAKLLVTTGYPYEESQLSEVLDLSNENTSCARMKNYPIPVDGAFGGLMDDEKPLICGGVFPVTNKCYIVGDESNDPVGYMKSPRESSGSLVYSKPNEDDKLYITGGDDHTPYPGFGWLNSTEVIEYELFNNPDGETYAGPDLPEPLDVIFFNKWSSSMD